ncbi:hypothetical protein ACNKU7_04645 [Microbulbifer sp. SA54]|uniref:hypothetical protein n=1 Tax=Microbulbifer sp. SA54 TaxID=3401577 RepID=UPI003AAF714A
MRIHAYNGTSARFWNAAGRKVLVVYLVLFVEKGAALEVACAKSQKKALKLRNSGVSLYFSLNCLSTALCLQTITRADNY